MNWEFLLNIFNFLINPKGQGCDCTTHIFKNLKTKSMKPVLIYDNNFYPYNGQFIAQGGDNIYLDYEIDGTRFFLVKFRTIDLANNQIILSIIKL